MFTFTRKQKNVVEHELVSVRHQNPFLVYLLPSVAPQNNLFRIPVEKFKIKKFNSTK